MGKDMYAVDRSLLSERCDRKLESDQKLRLNVRRSRVSAAQRWFFFQNIHGLHNSIPKHITTFDEKYAFRCLELIHNVAVRVAAKNFASKLDFLSGDMANSTIVSNRSSDRIARLAVERPLAFGTEVTVDSISEWTVGTVTHSQSMINILNSSLLQQFEPVYSNSAGCPHGLSSESSPDIPEEVTVFDHKLVPVPAHERVASTLSTNSSGSEESSSSSTAMYQGMLQCIWKGGLPHYVFTVDDKEVFLARVSKLKSLNDKDLDCVYTFYASKNSMIEFNTFGPDMESVGMMQVSKSVTLCSDSSKVVETRFVLSISNDYQSEETRPSNQNTKNNRRLTRKVASLFKPSRSYKHGTSSKFEEAGLVFNDAYSSTSEDVPNLELAAIIIKEHVLDNNKKSGLGGWGMKFLKKHGNEASRSQNSTKRSKSVDVLFPAGFHGGPRTRNCGPSGLIERWISGGTCDCGGWDIGCPLTVLSTKSTTMESLFVTEDSDECKSIDLFIQDSKQEAPPFVKMLNIRKGLYCINFQSTLSILQSFAIGAAIVHSRRPVIQADE